MASFTAAGVNVPVVMKSPLSDRPTIGIGRIGIVAGTRELVFHPWPYIAVYKVSNDAIRIIQIRHASRQYP